MMTAEEFGALLKARREAKGLAVEVLAARIKLSARTLRSIENGSLDGLPHAVYARGFVRSYAQLIGLDADEVNEGLESVFPVTVQEVPPMPGPIGRQRTGRVRGLGEKLIAFVLLLAVVVLPFAAGWFLFDSYGDTIIEWVKKPFIATSSNPVLDVDGAGIPTGLTDPAGNTPETTAPDVPDAADAADTTDSADGTASGAPDQTGMADTPPDMPTVASAEGTPSTGEGVPATTDAVPDSAPDMAPDTALVSTPPPASGEQTLHITAQAACWVRVQVDGAGPRSFELPRGSSSNWTFRRNLELTLGNAGGVTVQYNGRPFDLAARSGEVKTVQFPPPGQTR